MAVIKVTSENFKREVIDSAKPVLVDLNADWCGPCRMLAPLLEEVSASRDDVKIVSVNVDESSDIAAEFGVSAIPCLVLVKDGREVKRNVGFMNKSGIENMLG